MMQRSFSSRLIHPFLPLLCALSVLIITGCATNKAPTAPVIERLPPVVPTPAVVTPEEVKPEEKRGGYYAVKRGDTLIGIALQTGQDYREIAAWNNLEAPYTIFVGQVLHVLPPDGAVALPVNPPAVVSNVPLANMPNFKIDPIGLKRPYADAALAEMAKPDAPVNLGPAAASPVTPPAFAPVTAAATDDTSIAWLWPVPGKASEEFIEGKNKGVAVPGKAGDAVMAAADGKVLFAGNGIRGYGNMIIIKHSNNFVSVYAHNSKLLVVEQQAVKKGQKIAEMGNSDVDNKEVKLHFEIRNQGKPVDPLKYLPAR